MSNTHIQSQRPSILAGTVSTMVIGSLFVVARLFTRLAIVKRFGRDDTWILLAWALAFGLSFSICYGTSKGLGLHFTEIPKEWLPQLGPAIYAFTVLYYPAVLVTKISILALYLRIFRLNKFITRGSVAILLVIVCAYTSLTFVKAFRCRPVSAAWQLAPTGPVDCVDIVVIHLASTPVNVLTDLAIILLPIPVLTSLQLARQQKIMLLLTFTLAAFDVVVSVIRIVFLEQALLRNAVRNRLHWSHWSQGPVNSDFTYSESLAFMWSAVEVNIGIVCACILTLKPLIVRVFPHVFESSRRKHSRGSTSSTFSRIESSRTEEISPTSIPLERYINFPAVNGNPNASRSDCSDSDSTTAFSAVTRGPSAVEFITSPDMADASRHGGRTLVPQEPRPPSQKLFGCIQFSMPSKCLVNLCAKESYFPIAIMMILFFILEFAFELMNTNVMVILSVLPVSQLKAVQLQATYFCGYFVGPVLVSQFILKKVSFHTSLIVGLFIFGTAPMICWPSTILLSIPALMVSYFCLGLGLSVVYNVIFAFVTLCGPSQYAVIRLLLYLAVGNTGGLLSVIISTQVIFPANPTDSTILNSQWTFLGITFLFVFLAILIYHICLPEITDDELMCDAEYISGTHQRCPSPFKQHICNWDVAYTTLALGLFSAFCYSGVSSVITYFFAAYVNSMAPNSGLNVRYITWLERSAVIIGQLVAAAICYYIRSSWVLLSCSLLTIIFSTLMVTVNGTAGVVMIVVQRLFEGAIFPLLFSISLKGLGQYTKPASAYLTAALSAGALFIPVTYFAQKHPSANPIQYSFVVPLAGSCFGVVMPLFINISRAARKQVNRR